MRKMLFRTVVSGVKVIPGEEIDQAELQTQGRSGDLESEQSQGPVEGKLLKGEIRDRRRLAKPALLGFLLKAGQGLVHLGWGRRHLIKYQKR
jgi:hypothetical protein